MRTPFVKRQTPPLSGVLLFFRFPGTRRSRSSVACPDLISEHRCTPRAAPNPYGGSVAFEGDGRAVPLWSLCGLAIILSPHTVLCTRMAERAPFASESQVRERGSTREPLTTCVTCTRASAGVQSTAMDQGRVPQSFAAFYDAVHVRCSKDRGAG